MNYVLDAFQRTDKSLQNSPLGIWVLGGALLLTRVPFLGNGYGVDADAWRVVYQAFRMTTESRYFASRLPGYPLFELLNIPLLPLGWVYTNLATAIVSVIAILVFWRILLQINAKLPLLFALGMAFTPVIWVNSVTTMDYVWALACILVSFLTLLRGRIIMAALCLGVAVGFRPTSAIFLLPSLVYLWICGETMTRTPSLNNKLPSFVVTFGIAVLIAFSPVLLTYGLDVLPALSGRPPLLAAGYHGTVEIFGALGFVAMIVLALYVVATWRTSRREIMSSNQVRFAWGVQAYAIVASLSALILFAIFPDEGAYLIPAIPFAWLLLALHVHSPMALRLALIAVLLVTVSNFIDFRFWVRDEWGSRVLTTPYLGAGMLIEDAQQRQSDIQLTSGFLTLAQAPKTVVMAGWRMPIARALNEIPSLRSQPIVPTQRIVDLMPRENVESYLQEGYWIYHGPGVRSMTLSVLGYDLEILGKVTYFDGTALK